MSDKSNNTTFSTDTCDCLANVAPASDCQVCREANLKAQRDEALDKLSKLRSAAKAFIRSIQKSAREGELTMCDQAHRGEYEGCYILATKHDDDHAVDLCDDCADYLAEEGDRLPPLEDFAHAASLRNLRDLLRKP